MHEVVASADEGDGRAPELDGHRDRLITKHVSQGFDQDEVLASFDRIYRRLASARVRTYLPLLAERALRVELEVNR